MKFLLTIFRSKQLLLFAFSLFFITCKAQKREEREKPSKQEMKGLEFLKKGETNKAIDMFEKGIAQRPDDKSLLNMLGSLYVQIGENEKAAQRLKQLTIYHPSYTNGYFFLAEVQYDIMQYDACLLSLDTFLLKKSPRKDLVEKGELLYKKASFASTMLKNPVDVTFENMGKNINTKDHEYWPGLTIDEQFFVFTRQHHNREDIFISKKIGNEWGKAISLPGEVNSMMNEGTVSVTADGKYIFYTMCERKEGFGSCDIYLSILQPDGSFSKPRLLGPPLNTAAWESQPSISPDGLTLYFSSGRQGGYGGKDIWKSEWKGTHFGEPENLGPNINTARDEQAPFIHADEKTLYFSSNGRIETMGGADLYLSRLGENGWEKPQNLGYPINTSDEEFGMIVDRLGQFAYFSSNRPGGMGGMDIYKFELPVDKRPEPVSYVKGIVFDKITKEPLQAKIELIDLATGKVVKKTSSDKSNGSFIAVLSKDKSYMFNVDKESYLFYSENFVLNKGSLDKPFVIEAPLSKPDSGSVIVLNNIFFDVDKYSLKPESSNEVQKVVEFLQKFPEMKIEIGGHTDNTGNKDRNYKLSENRAKAVMDSLVDLGIPKNRMTAKGYADELPVDTNETPEGRAQNRRTEIKILSVK
jgi:outer membrane protein OmpA-like peptidoglycan-associated protein/tetratricopeptide (TPR) repeat protein